MLLCDTFECIQHKQDTATTTTAAAAAKQGRTEGQQSVKYDVFWCILAPPKLVLSRGIEPNSSRCYEKQKKKQASAKEEKQIDFPKM